MSTVARPGTGINSRQPDGFPGPSIVPRIRRALLARLDHLERERRAIRRALDALASRPAIRRKTEERAQSDGKSVLQAVHAEPGVRASMLALWTGRDTQEIAAELVDLEEAGLVRRSGLGWKALDKGRPAT